MPPPDEESRAQILALELRKMPLNFVLPPYGEHMRNTNDTENRDKNRNENEIKFDWHTSNPIEIITDLDLKLSTFSFSDNYDIEKTTQVIKEGNEDVHEDEEYSVDQNNILSELLRKTLGFSGAEMVAAVQEAGMLAIDSGADVLDVTHLFSAIDGIIPQITPDVIAFYEKIAAEY